MANDWFGEWFQRYINPFNYDFTGQSSGRYNRGLDYIAGGEAGYNRWKYEMSKFPGIGDFYRWQDADKYWSDYFKNYPDLDWSKVQYPTMMAGSGISSKAVSSAFGMQGRLSRTIDSLYKGINQDTGTWTPSRQKELRIRTPYLIRNGGYMRYDW